MPGGHNTAPEARNIFRIHHSAVMIARPQLSLRGHTFFCLARKKYAKKRRRTRNSAGAQKGVSFRCACCRFSFRRPNALRATVELGFRIARQTTQVVMLAPVEYLTYGSRGVSDLV